MLVDFQFIIDPKRRIVIAKSGNCVSLSGIEKYVRTLRIHPYFDPSFSEIADISNAKELPANGSELLKLADRIDPFSLGSKRAFVAQTPGQIHAARIHQSLRSQRSFEIFQTLEEAERWISKPGLQAASLEMVELTEHPLTGDGISRGPLGKSL